MLSSKINLIVGLGNPGIKHEADRHNAGLIFLRQLCLAFGGKLSGESKFFGEFGKISINTQEVRLLFPTTFMNASGRSVASVAQFYKLSPENILVAL
jgi:PTH1 family peptidyl-tRNA hydrolase